jgi:hypothetical protein
VRPLQISEPRAAIGARGTPHRYRVFGLRIASNVSLPGLVPAPANESADVTVELAPRGPWWREHTRDLGDVWRIHPVADEGGRPVVQVRRRTRDGRFHLRYADGTEFTIDPRRQRIWGCWPEHFTLADAATYLIGPVLGFVLRLRGGVSLHASAVSIRDRAVLFLGPSGAGKSTLAAALARRGHAVLCDDAASIAVGASGVWVRPGSTRVRLWPDSVEALYGAADRLPLLTPNWGKRYLDLSALPGRFCRRALPLASVYLLEPRTQDARAPRIESIKPRDALHQLLSQSYVGYLQDASMRAHEFKVLGGLVGVVDVKRLHPSASPRRLEALCDLVTRDVAASVGD